MRPLIGLPAHRHTTAPWRPMLHGQRESYIEAITAAGGLPVIVPLLTPGPALHDLYRRLDGLLLCGGQDLSPQWYGRPNRPANSFSENVDPRHDHVELQLIRWALADRKPILGICRGLQVLNVACGGTLYGDLPSERPSDIDHRASRTRQSMTHLGHHLILDPDSRLAAILGSVRFSVNSLHHQAINQLGARLRAVGRADDGLIEAVEGPEPGFILGVQHHPEAITGQPHSPWSRLFAAFVTATAATQPVLARKA